MTRRLICVSDLPDYSGHPNSPWTDVDDYAEEPPTMSRRELINLACAGDLAAQRVIENEVEFDGTIGGIDAGTDEEIAEWYGNELTDAGRSA